jgi:8-demethyl-8-(2-methoxy-alpha-L-rhamnosyl)tetracenomycin-C 3'-O-methyltransferase
MTTLDDIAVKFRTDKASTPYTKDVYAYPSHTGHNYTAVYDRMFTPLRDEPVTLLELGVFTGASMRMWAEYFPDPNAKFVGVDIDLSLLGGTISDPRVTLHEGDQSDTTLVGPVARQFDIIIDDASHISSKTVESFTAWWPYLRDGGVYVVEDTHSSFHAFHYGEGEANEDPAQNATTAMGFFQRLAMDVNYHGATQWDLFPSKYWQGYWLDAVEFRFNLIILTKGRPRR